MTTAQEKLQWYIDRGYSVFPVQVTNQNGKWEKKPLVPWKDYSTRLATQDEIDVWTTMLGDEFNAIGMATGELSKVLVVDVDDPDSLHGFDSPTKVKTISGGHHLWFKYRSGVRNTVKINNKPIDVRGEGGFVVVPPSGEGEHRYKWVSYAAELPAFPEIIEDKPAYKPPLTALPQASEGNRNHTAIQVAGHIIASTKPSAWETTGWSAFKQWNQENVTPPIEEYELRNTFESAKRMETVNHPKPEDRIKVSFGDGLETRFTQLTSRWGRGLTTGYPVLDEWFTLQPEQLYLVSSETHFGKTTLTLNIAARVAALGHHVLFCSLEQGLYVVPRIKSLLGGSLPPTFGMLDSDVLVDAQSLISTFENLNPKPELIVIDHLHFMKKDTKHGITGGVDQMIIDIQNAAKTMGIPVIVIAHQRKLNGKDIPDLDDLRDSSSLSQVPSVVVQLSRKRDESGSLEMTGVLHIRKNRIGGRTGNLTFHLADSGAIEITEYHAHRVETIKKALIGDYPGGKRWNE